MSVDLRLGDAVQWANDYTGEKFHALLDVKLPNYFEFISMLNSVCGFLYVVLGIPDLNRSQGAVIVNSRIGVPKSPMNFNKGIVLRNVEIITVSSQAVLLFKDLSHAAEVFGNLVFKFVVSLASSTFFYLFGSKQGVAFSGIGAAELPLVSRLDFSDCLRGMSTPKHSILATWIGFVAWLDARPLHAFLDCALSKTVEFRNVILAFAAGVESAERFVTKVYAAAKSLCFAVGTAGNAKFHKPLTDGWIGNFEIFRYLGQRHFLFNVHLFEFSLI